MGPAEQTTAPTSAEAGSQLGQRLTERIEAGALALPILPESSTRLMELTRAEAFDVRRLSELLGRDPLLAAQVLRMANSAMYGGSATIVSIKQAIARLGATTLRQLALITACQAGAFRVPAHQSRVRTLFRRSLIAAYFAQEISRIRRTNVETAFLGALIHDVGTAIILHELGPLPSAGAAEAFVAFESCVALCHAQVGALVAERWNLPPPIAEVIRHHHAAAPPAEVEELVFCVQLADSLSEWTTTDAFDEQALRTHPALEPLRLYPDHLAKLMSMRDLVTGATEEIS